MGLITEVGRAAMAKALKEQTMFLAFGSGSPEWGDGNPPAEDVGATGLLNEIGRKALNRSFYVTPDENGDIEVPTSLIEDGLGGYSVVLERYALSAAATRYIYVEFKLDYADALNATIRELGLYTGAALKDAVPGGQTLFTAEDFENAGLLFEI